MTTHFYLPNRCEIDEAVLKLHNSPYMVAIEATGGGLGLQGILWDVAGASRTLITAGAPYSRATNRELVGRTLDRSVSLGTARGMAARAYDRGVRLAREDELDVPIIGLGMSCAVVTDHDRNGREWAIASIRKSDGIFSAIAIFDKTAKLTRREQGHYSDLLGLNMILWAAGLPQLPIFDAHDIVRIEGSRARKDLWGHKPLVPTAHNADQLPTDGSIFWPDGSVTLTDGLSPDKHILFPVSANPLHSGHENMARKVEDMTGKQVVMHVTGSHPIKPTLTPTEMWGRIDHVMGKWPVLTTWNDPRYVNKAERFPGMSFILGADALELLLEPRFSGQSVGGVVGMFNGFAELGTHFFIAARLDREKRRLVELQDIALPEGVAESMFTAIPGLWDVSSSQIRAETTKR
ncbi:MAG: hypothetical protein NUV56_02675 [Candidatus Uhrbacteria bacterium]|nr:hypothetical protein [Candidatus Uhrbacteria bacterium]